MIKVTRITCIAGETAICEAVAIFKVSMWVLFTQTRKRTTVYHEGCPRLVERLRKCVAIHFVNRG